MKAAFPAAQSTGDTEPKGRAGTKSPSALSFGEELQTACDGQTVAGKAAKKTPDTSIAEERSNKVMPAKRRSRPQSPDTSSAMASVLLQLTATTCAEVPTPPAGLVEGGDGVQASDAALHSAVGRDSTSAPITSPGEGAGETLVDFLTSAVAEERAVSEDEPLVNDARGSSSPANGELVEDAAALLQANGPADADQTLASNAGHREHSTFSPEDAEQPATRDMASSTLVTNDGDADQRALRTMQFGAIEVEALNHSEPVLSADKSAVKASSHLESRGGTVRENLRTTLSSEQPLPAPHQGGTPEPANHDVMSRSLKIAFEERLSEGRAQEPDSDAAAELLSTEQTLGAGVVHTSLVSGGEGDRPIGRSASSSSGSVTGRAIDGDGVERPVLSPLQSAHLLRRIEHTEIRLGLNTEKFGTVRLKTSIEAERVGAVIDTSHPGLKAALVSEAPSLEKAISQHRLQLEVLSLDGGQLSSGSNGLGGERQERFAGPNLPRPAPLDSDRRTAVATVAAVSSSGSRYRLDVQA